MTGHVRGVLSGLAQLLEARTDAAYTYREDGSIPDGATPVYLQATPAVPDRAVTLYLSPRADNPSMPLGGGTLFVRGRGRPGYALDADDDCDAAFDVLHGLVGLQLPSGHSIVQLNRVLVIPMGTDEAKRTARQDQYDLDLDYPPTLVRPDGGSW